MAIAEATDPEMEETPSKSGKKGMIIALIVALGAAGGGFFATYSGMILGAETSDETEAEPAIDLKPVPNAAFVPLDPLVVSIRSSSKYRLLKFTSQLEVDPEHLADIDLLKPRIVDVMNTYLNALEASKFEDPIAMIKLRAQLLRRIQIVTGEGRIKDLLIMEFVLQ